MFCNDEREIVWNGSGEVCRWWEWVYFPAAISSRLRLQRVTQRRIRI